MKWTLYLFILLGILSCKEDKPISTTQVIQREGFINIINEPSEKIQVINFWATWCAPCVEELPYFEKVNSKYDDVDVVLISLDDVEKVTSTVNPFLKEKEIKSSVYLLDDPYAAEWIPIVDDHWDGAIPVTLIKKGKEKYFINKAVTYDQLEEAIAQFR
ncbi:thioredoxin [Nonlabens sp. MIC269]|uniref:redoxin family protein n=1 Tax=Nonlabens sp. MIC269 TaxID=1476901 RepID=UPI000722E64E|nr:thioredoxin domain-containing protein [Nonlabens sp. MIC269]ALM21900.1 thioredoxin [Nonlabens sp. MIC269]